MYNKFLTLPGRRTGHPVLLTSRNSFSVILAIKLSRHNDSDGLGYELCKLKLVLSVSESKLRDVNRMGYPVRRPGRVLVNVKHVKIFFYFVNPAVKNTQSTSSASSRQSSTERTAGIHSTGDSDSMLSSKPAAKRDYRTSSRVSGEHSRYSPTTSRDPFTPPPADTSARKVSFSGLNSSRSFNTSVLSDSQPLEYDSQAMDSQPESLSQVRQTPITTPTSKLGSKDIARSLSTVVKRLDVITCLLSDENSRHSVLGHQQYLALLSHHIGNALKLVNDNIGSLFLNQEIIRTAMTDAGFLCEQLHARKDIPFHFNVPNPPPREAVVRLPRELSKFRYPIASTDEMYRFVEVLAQGDNMNGMTEALGAKYRSPGGEVALICTKVLSGIFDVTVVCRTVCWCGTPESKVKKWKKEYAQDLEDGIVTADKEPWWQVRVRTGLKVKMGEPLKALLRGKEILKLMC